MKREREFITYLLLLAICLVINTINFFTLIETLNNKEEVTEETTITEGMTAQVETIVTTCPEEEKIELPTEEFEVFCILGATEFGLQPLEGQIAGFASILSRWLESPEHPDTLLEVIYDPDQYSSVWDGEIHILKNGSYVVAQHEDVREITILAAQLALAGEDPTEELLRQEAERLGLDPVKYAEGGALYFYNPDYCGEFELEYRSAIKVQVRIGDHIFYKFWDLPPDWEN